MPESQLMPAVRDTPRLAARSAQPANRDEGAMESLRIAALLLLGVAALAAPAAGAWFGSSCNMAPQALQAHNHALTSFKPCDLS